MAARSDWQHWLVDQWQRPRPSGLLHLLRPVSWLYGLLAAGHRALYAWGLRRTRSAPRPVVVIGNLVAGGAGKTPTVMALVEQLRALGRTPGVISRGHGGSATAAQLVRRDSAAAEVGDEPLLIRLRCDAPVAVGHDRIAAAEALCRAHPEVDLLLADDGLQHRALARDVQVLVFDDRGAGNGRLLPAGPLREPMPRTVPPATLVLYTHGRASTPLPGALGRRRLAGFTRLEDWWAGAPPVPASALAGRRVLAAAGLARPEGFFRMLEQEGLAIDRLALPDHASLDPPPWSQGASEVVVTEKDAVKLRPGRSGGTRIWVATLDFDLPSEFGRAVLALLQRPAPPPNAS